MPDFEDPKDFPTADVAHIVALVDESGSMSRSRETTVSALNEYIDGLRSSLPEDTLVTINKFTSHWFVDPTSAAITTALAGATATTFFGRAGVSKLRMTPLVDRVKLKDVPTFKLSDYTPTAGTPLLDAIGTTITRIDAEVKETPGPVFLAILTDGGENESTSFRLEQIRGMIDTRQQAGWTIAFIGVDIDAYADAAKYGISPHSTVSVNRDNIQSSMSMTGAAVSRKFDASRTMDRATYASWNSGDATYSAEDKAKVEKSST